ncbi:radical SAM protein [Desulforhopalus vacuolatus]|uniref:elongator complex protein 3 n=1 Tax=Desulforhopalus vacuolatus TaxID=40414 RepID=UPI001962C59F|nr:radical SAM protein [Desulforhopalus vacuolatus]MBM9519546.1 radical SAM protein [Desulforhopalus vacuolatus]
MVKDLLVIPIFIPHQGCPHVCIFCNQTRISGSSRLLITPEAVQHEVRRWLVRENAHGNLHSEVQVAFFGGSFTCLPVETQQGLLAAVQPFIARGEVNSIRCSTRPDCIDSQRLAVLKQAGVSTVELGVQSMDDEVLRRARRGHNAEDTRCAITLLKETGFTTGVQIMPGLPGETFESFMEGVKELTELGPDIARIYPLLVVEDSGLVSPWLLGDYQPLSLDTALDWCSVALSFFEKADVRVIRIGLQPAPSLEGSILAGPWHPAFGAMVESRRWFYYLENCLKPLKEGEWMDVTVSHRDISSVIGINKENRKRLDALGYAGRYRITADRSVAKGSFYAVCKQS